MRCVPILGIVTLSLMGCGFSNVEYDEGAVPSQDAAPDAKAASYAALVLADGPIGYWRCEDPSGAGVVRDEVDPPTDGAVLQSSVLARPGGFGESLAIMVSESGAVTWDGAAFGFPDRAPFSVEGFFRSDVGDQRQRLFSKFGASGWVLEDSVEYGLRALRYGNGYVDFAYTDSLVVKKWTHIVVTYDSETLCLYVQGKQADCKESLRQIKPQADPLAVGWGMPFVGAVDELAIYNRALDEATILGHYEVTQP